MGVGRGGRGERVTVQGPGKKQQPDGMSHGGTAVRDSPSAAAARLTAPLSVRLGRSDRGGHADPHAAVPPRRVRAAAAAPARRVRDADAGRDHGVPPAAVQVCALRPCGPARGRQTTPATTSTSSKRQLLGAANAQTAHPATSSTAPAHQPLGSATAETTPAGARAAAADRTQRPDATCEGTNG